MLFRLLVAIVIIYLIYRTAKWLMSWSRKASLTAKDAPPVVREDLVEDPFCHIYLPKSLAHKSLINGQVVYFCSQKCREDYLKRN